MVGGTSLANREQSALSSARLTEEQKELIKRTVAKGATDDELVLFWHFCQKAGVDPLRKQAHFIKYKENAGPIMMIGIDGFQARATSDPRYQGLISFAVYENDEFEMNPVTAEITHKFGAKNRGKILGAYALLRRKDMAPAVIWVAMSEYSMNRDNWRTKPDVMITKVARATLLRREYPDAFSGVYEPAEFGGEITEQGDVVIPDEPTKKKTSKPKAKPKSKPSGYYDPSGSDNYYDPPKPEPKSEQKPEPAQEQRVDEPVQDVEFSDVEEGIEVEEEPDADEGEYLYPDLIDDSMTPREALQKLLDTALYDSNLHIIRNTIREVNKDFIPGKMHPYHLPEGDVREVVYRLTGTRLKRVERASKCKKCKATITKPEKEKQEGLCLECWNKRG